MFRLPKARLFALFNHINFYFKKIKKCFIFLKLFNETMKMKPSLCCRQDYVILYADGFPTLYFNFNLT